MTSNNSPQSYHKGRVGLLGTKYLISAANMDRAVEFYRDVIGLDVQVFTPYWSELTHGTATVALHGGGDGSYAETGLSFTVKDIFEACPAIIKGGGSVRSEPEDRGDEGIYLAFVTDTENNGIMISQVKNSKLET
ncbi:MAG: VOC family protein [Gammaproteobacteria bacterium]|nr:VOC family protein [Gammaproteobacteria bacterium]